MLKNNDKIKIEQYIDKIVFDIQKDLKSWIPYDRFNIMHSLIHDKLIVNKVINVIVDRFTKRYV